LYGATRCEVYVNGVAGERFCVETVEQWLLLKGQGSCAELDRRRLIVLGNVGKICQV
jgi:glutamate synthase domain-containing protein 3